MIVRVLAIVLILAFVFAFVITLLLLHYSLGTALAGASGAGVVAAEIIHRLLGGPPSDNTGGLQPRS